MLRGSLTALVTPFEKGGAFDEKAFRRVRRMADRAKAPRPGAGRHDRRVADAVA